MGWGLRGPLAFFSPFGRLRRPKGEKWRVSPLNIAFPERLRMRPLARKGGLRRVPKGQRPQLIKSRQWRGERPLRCRGLVFRGAHTIIRQEELNSIPFK